MTRPPALLCLPPAGVGPSLFRPWAHPPRQSMTVVPVAMPGKEIRFGEPLPASIDRLADALADELEPWTAGRYALFGYSMGALLGYEIARRFARRGLPGPEMFFVLGCNAPDRMLDNRAPFHTMAPQEFRQALIDLGGIHPEILDNAEAMELFEPVLRNDFRICETYEYGSRSGKIGCPAHVFVAEEDDIVSGASASAWKDFVVEETVLHTIPGRHMIDRAIFSGLIGTVEELWLNSGVSRECAHAS